MASRKSHLAARLILALALCLNLHKVCLLMPVHIPSVENALTDFPSRSFGSNLEWFCLDKHALLTFFSCKFPIPNQASWTIFHFTTKMTMRLTSILRMKDSMLAEWRQLLKIGHHIGDIGYCRPLGLDPYLQGIEYMQWVHFLTGFAGHIRRGAYGLGKQVQAGMVMGALMSIGQVIVLACGENPTSSHGATSVSRGSNKCMMGGERKTW